jgi:hypothetical protein
MDFLMSPSRFSLSLLPTPPRKINFQSQNYIVVHIFYCICSYIGAIAHWFGLVLYGS